MLPLIAVALIIAGLMVLLLGRRTQAEAGLPIGRVVYADTGDWHAVEKPLFSETYRLTGRPDYLVQHGRQIIPVEVKSTVAPPNGPHRGHVLQLAAYCLLVEENYQQRPKYGIVKYADRMFEVDFTDNLAATLLDVIAAMQDDLLRGGANRSHTETARCLRCGFRQACDERLA